MFTLYFLIPHCMTERLRPSCSFQPLWSYLGYVVLPRDPWALAFSGIPPNFPYWAFFWLTDFGRLGLSFSLWNFKAFSLHGSLDPNSLDFFHSSLLSFFFFLSSLQDSPMCYFSLGLGLWLILNLNSGITK